MQALSAAVGFEGLWRRKLRNNILQHDEEQMIIIDRLSGRGNIDTVVELLVSVDSRVLQKGS